MRFSYYGVPMLFWLTILPSCSSKGPYVTPYEVSIAEVIGKENCFADSSKNYWLFDFGVLPDTKQYGDTITLNGKVYPNVVKALGLRKDFDTIGKVIGLSFKVSSKKSQTAGCDVSSPATFSLREITILQQSMASY